MQIGIRNSRTTVHNVGVDVRCWSRVVTAYISTGFTAGYALVV